MKKLQKKTKKSILYFLILIIVSTILVSLLLLFLEGKGFTYISSGNANKEPIVIPTVKIIDLESDSRPYAVMINNISVAQPYQSGLQDAFLVYEIVAEGGISRLMAVYKDKDVARIGSVRSARHYYQDYALENDAIYVHYGWSPQAQSEDSAYNIDNINGLYDSAFNREYNLPVASEHTAFTSTALINQVVAKRGFETTTTQESLLNYTPYYVRLMDLENSIVANNVSITYSTSHTVSFTYDVETGLYKRFQNGNPHIDYVTKEQYTAKNIIITPIENTPIDSYGRQDLHNITTGTGYYITNGYAVPITWEKTSKESQTVYKHLNGEEIKVSDGNTYIQIQPLNQPLVIN